MRSVPVRLTTTELLASATRILTRGKYNLVTDGGGFAGSTSARLFEDQYNVVGVAAFQTCTELLRSWPSLQAELVDVISRKVGHAEAKAWDGHLVLLTGAVAPSEAANLAAVRYDTTRLRKLVATGEELTTLAEVERVLKPLLPLELRTRNLSGGNALELLPGLLEKNHIDRETTELLVQSFVNQDPLMAALHREISGR